MGAACNCTKKTNKDGKQDDGGVLNAIEERGPQLPTPKEMGGEGKGSGEKDEPEVDLPRPDEMGPPKSPL